MTVRIEYQGHTIEFRRVIIDPDDTPVPGFELFIDGESQGSQFVSIADWVIEEAEWLIDNVRK